MPNDEAGPWRRGARQEALRRGARIGVRIARVRRERKTPLELAANFVSRSQIRDVTRYARWVSSEERFQVCRITRAPHGRRYQVHIVKNAGLIGAGALVLVGTAGIGMSAAPANATPASVMAQEWTPRVTPQASVSAHSRISLGIRLPDRRARHRPRRGPLLRCRAVPDR